MSDNGAKLVATFLNSPQSKGKLEVLNLSLNSLKDKGAIALADVASLTKKLFYYINCYV